MSRWQDELKSVDGPDSRMVFTMEPAAATLPGMTIHNIQLSVLTRPAYGEQPSIWARKRSQGIEFYPVLLGTAASEIDPTNEEPLEAAIWCAAEQASSGRGHCQAHIKSAARCCTYTRTKTTRLGERLARFSRRLIICLSSSYRLRPGQERQSMRWRAFNRAKLTG